MADLVAVSPLTLDLIASLAATDQILAIIDPAGSPSLGRSPVSALGDHFADLSASNITVDDWKDVLSIPGVYQFAANSTARFALTGILNRQKVIQQDDWAIWELIDQTDISNVASWQLVGFLYDKWSNIQNKPTTFTPSAHTHTASEITDFAAAVGAIAQSAVGGAVEDNLASFDASGFVQDSGIAGADVILEGDSRLTDNRDPNAHTHPFSEITGTIAIGQFPAGLGLQVLRRDSANTGLEFVSIPGGGDMLSTNNLSDVADVPTARVNLGLEIGVDVQAYAATLDSLAGLSAPAADRILFWDFSAGDFDWLVPSSNLAITTTNIDVGSNVMLKTGNLAGLSNTGTARGNLGVAIGTDVQAQSAYLDFIDALGDLGADRILFWDESAGVSGEWAALTVGTGLDLTTTTLTVDQSAIDHGTIAGLTDDDHTQYLLASGLREWDEQAGDPSTPASTKWKLYFKSGGLYYIDDLGAVIGPLGTGGGSVATDAIWDAAGDLAVGTGANTAAKLTMGSALQVLRVNSGGTALEYATPSGGSGSLTLARWEAVDGKPPSANFATLDTRNYIPVLDFDASTDESTVFIGIVPEGAVLTGGVAIYIHWMATSATSGAVIWEASLERSNTDLDSDSFDTVAFASGSANGTSGIITKTTITTTNIDSMVAGDLFRLKISRDANGTNGTDDMTGDAELVAVELRGVA